MHFLKRLFEPPKHIDIILLITVFALAIFGWIMMSSLSGPSSLKIYTEVFGKTCNDINITENCNDFFMKKHFWNMLLGLVLWAMVMFVPYKIWQKISPVIFSVTVLLLVIVLFSSLGSKAGTFAKSWILIPFLPSIQPTEIAKIALVLYLATWMAKRAEQIQTLKEGFIPFSILTSIIILPIIAQPDFGSALIISATAAVIYFLAGARLSHLLIGLTIVAMLISIFISFYPHLQQRIFTRFFPTEDCRENECYQTYQSLIAIGSGGFMGRGYNKSLQKHQWLPEIKTDYIFAGIAEELGFFWVLIVVLAYLIIMIRSYVIAKYAPDRFARFTVIGIGVCIVVQAYLNIAVNLDLFPVTGVTLPLISHGGSSLITTFLGLGIILNISRYVTNNTANVYQRRRIRRPHYSQPRSYRRTRRSYR